MTDDKKSTYEGLIRRIESGEVPGSVLSIKRLMEARRGTYPTWGEWLSNGEKEEELQVINHSTLNLYTQMTTALSDYESATNAKDRFKAESRICRIADHLGQNTMITMPNGSVSVPTVEHWNGFRIPRLEKIVPTEGESDMPRMSLVDVKNNPLFRAFLGNDDKIVEEYLAAIRRVKETKIGLYFPIDQKED